MQDMASLAQQLLQSSPDALLVVDAQGIIRYANATTEALFGHAADHLVGQPLDVLIPERFRHRHGSLIAVFLKAPANREMGARINDLFARRADGAEFPAGIRLSPFIYKDSACVAVAVRDMTERRVISNALVAAREEADRANRANSRFLAAASHDLRQPMQVIRLLNASLLRMLPPDAAQRDLLQRQGQAIDSASNLLNALLDVSRLESGAIEPDLTTVELGGVFADLQREFEPAAAARSLTMEVATTDLRLLTDRTMFVQLMQNLIGNSLKYTDRGGLRVVHELETDSLVLSVIDTGIGIPKDKLARIFDEYYQVDSREGTKRQGVGLGLAIVREVARILGFVVTVSSRQGEGTTVQVRIPRKQLVRHEPRSGDPAPLAAPPLPVQRCNVLLVEDNASVRAATEMFLGLEGFPTRSAASPAEAESLIATMQPGDVLVTDFRFGGGLTGLDIVHQARARHTFRVPVVLLSGDLDSMLRTIREPLPHCRFLSKPVDVEVLLAALAELNAA